MCGALSEIWPGIGALPLNPLEGSGEGVAPDEPVHEVRARELLGEQAYAAAYDRGRRMTVEDVVSFVLDERQPSPATRPPRLDEASADLTKRELEVAELVARGLSNKEIAEALVISPRTAEGHVARLLDKLGFTTRARVAAWVAERRAGGPDRPSLSGGLT